MSQAQIIYISNDKYKLYKDKFLSTLHYLLPGIKKHLTVITDAPNDFSNYIAENNIDIEYDTILMPSDIPYPCVNLSKFAYIKSFIKPEFDYVFYFDADTYFFEVDAKMWNYITNSMNNDEILFTFIPVYTTGFYPEVYREDCRQNRFYDIDILNGRCNERENSPLYESMGIPDKTYPWALSSFFCGKTSVIYNFVDAANERLKTTMRGEKNAGIPVYHVPRLFDETVANKMIYESMTGDDIRFKFNVGPYAAFSFRQFPRSWFIQKYLDTANKNHD